MTNPWMKLDHQRANQFGSENAIELAVEHRCIDSEYADTPEPEVCGKCGQMAHYRAGVGTLQCPSRHILSWAGDWR